MQKSRFFFLTFHLLSLLFSISWLHSNLTMLETAAASIQAHPSQLYCQAQKGTSPQSHEGTPMIPACVICQSPGPIPNIRNGVCRHVRRDCSKTQGQLLWQRNKRSVCFPNQEEVLGRQNSQCIHTVFEKCIYILL